MRSGEKMTNGSMLRGEGRIRGEVTEVGRRENKVKRTQELKCKAKDKEREREEGKERWKEKWEICKRVNRNRVRVLIT